MTNASGEGEETLLELVATLRDSSPGKRPHGGKDTPLLFFNKERQGSCKAVQETALANRADLTVAEESA